MDFLRKNLIYYSDDLAEYTQSFLNDLFYQYSTLKTNTINYVDFISTLISDELLSDDVIINTAINNYPILVDCYYISYPKELYVDDYNRMSWFLVDRVSLIMNFSQSYNILLRKYKIKTLLYA